MTNNKRYRLRKEYEGVSYDVVEFRYIAPYGNEMLSGYYKDGDPDSKLWFTEGQINFLPEIFEEIVEPTPTSLQKIIIGNIKHGLWQLSLGTDGFEDATNFSKYVVGKSRELLELIKNNEEQLSQSIPSGKGTANETINEEKKDWEIVAYKSSLGYVCKLRANGRYCYDNQGSTGIWELDVMLKDSTIESVKRLSDNEVFSVKDDTQFGIIKKFRLYEESGIMEVHFEDGSGTSFQNIRHKSTPTANDVVNEGWDKMKSDIEADFNRKREEPRLNMSKGYKEKLNEILSDNPVLDRQDKKERIEVGRLGEIKTGEGWFHYAFYTSSPASWVQAESIKKAIETILNQ